MATIKQSLASITTGYSVFEQNQVLTAEQLNGLGEYADAQIRLARVCLSGVGVASGLRPRIDPDGSVILSPGLGVSSDGDLLRAGEELVYTQYRVHDRSHPEYGPFVQADGRLLTLVRLLPADVVDARARPLSELFADTGLRLTEAVGVLYMESAVHDDDLCSGTDCDNLGQDVVNTQKLLLVGRGEAAALRAAFPTLGDAFRAIPEIALQRPVLSPTTRTVAELTAAWVGPCVSGLFSVVSALDQLMRALGPALRDPARPLPEARAWRPALVARLRAASERGVSQLQYYHDHLKDIADTVSEIRELVFGDDVWLCTRVSAFPKHLLLGELSPAADPDANRTGWYPSPASAGPGSQDEVRFLIQKLNAMILGFRAVAATATDPIHITPSVGEAESLQRRAIPYYYDVAAANPSALPQRWSHRRLRQGTWDRQLGWAAGSWSTEPAVLAPLSVQIGRYGFFRVEGHVGREVRGAVTELRAQIAARNVPIGVVAVLAGTDRDRLLIRDTPRFTDINRVLGFVQKDLATILKGLARSGDNARDKFRGILSAPTSDTRVSAETVRRVEAETEAHKASAEATVRDLTLPQRSLFKARSKSGRKTIVSTLLKSVNPTVKKSVQVSETLGEVGTQIATPASVTAADQFAAQLSAAEARWVQWLTELILARDDVEDEDRLLGPFIARHPAVEHQGGAPRGGTLVLVYGEDGAVVGDLSLPYLVAAPQDAEEPTLNESLLLDGEEAAAPIDLEEALAALDEEEPPVGASLSERPVDPALSRLIDALDRQLDRDAATAPTTASSVLLAPTVLSSAEPSTRTILASVRALVREAEAARAAADEDPIDVERNRAIQGQIGLARTLSPSEQIAVRDGVQALRDTVQDEALAALLTQAAEAIVS